MVGITAFGAYVPKLRLQREAIAKANTWFDPSLAALAQGERSFCNWDEDSVTMAVEAARDATESATRGKIGAICLASTSLPFLDRQNAGIVAEALQLNEALRTMDVTGSQRAGTTGLLSMVDAVEAGCQSAMLVASEFNGLVERDYGKRAEVDTPSPLSALYRNRKMVNAFSGGRCTTCGTVQFPKSVYCVNPECGAADTQEDHCMADASGKVRTWTADQLTFDMNPPAYFGLVDFDGGGRAMMDFTDVDPETFDVDTPVSSHFRIKQIDKRRGFRRYFWKAAPR